jgi:hypothetical protein
MVMLDYNSSTTCPLTPGQAGICYETKFRTLTVLLYVHRDAVHDTGEPDTKVEAIGLTFFLGRCVGPLLGPRKLEDSNAGSAIELQNDKACSS